MCCFLRSFSVLPCVRVPPCEWFFDVKGQENLSFSNNSWFCRRGGYFFTEGQAVWTAFPLNTFKKIIIWKRFSGYICVTLKLVWGSESFERVKCAEAETENQEEGQILFQRLKDGKVAGKGRPTQTRSTETVAWRCIRCARTIPGGATWKTNSVN